MTKTTYSPEMLEKMWDYFERWQEIFPDDVSPTWEGLCEYLEVGRQTLRDWKNRHEEVAELHERLMNRKVRLIINGGLSKKFDSKMAAIMIGPHGYVAQSKTDLISSDGSMSPSEMTDEELDRRIAAYLDK